MTNKSLIAGAVAFGASFTCITSAVSAQTSAETSQVKELDVVIVRALRRDEALTDVPVQVTALNADELLKNDILTLEDLGAKVPNTFATSQNGYGGVSLSIRGVGSTAGGEEPIALFFDDQFIPGGGVNATSMFDLESIEILRGPQVTLYGRNATGGAVLFRSARPDLNEFGGHGRIQLGSNNEQRYEVGLGGPIVPGKVGFRLAGIVTDREGWATNTFNGEDFDSSESKRIRGSLLWTPTDRTEILASLEVGEIDFSVARAGIADRSIGPRVLLPSNVLAEFEDGNFAANSPVNNSSEDARALLSLTHKLNGFDFIASAGYFFQDTMGETDSDGTAVNLFSNTGKFETIAYSQDLRLVSNGNGDLDWVAGLSGVQSRQQIPFFIIRNNLAFGGAGGDFRFFSKSNTAAYAAYAEATYALTDKLSVTAGGRWTNEKKDAEIDTLFLLLFNGAVLADPPVFIDDKSWTEFKPRGILEYELNDNVNVYGSVSTGFKSGGYNLFASVGPYDEENILAYEAGLKGKFWDGKLTMSSAAFHYRYTDLQLRLGVPTGGVAITNAADATISGLEMEWTARPSDGLDLFGSFAILETNFEDYTTRDLSGNLIDASGNELSRSPNFQVAIGGNYQWTLGNDLFARLGAVASHRSKVFFLETDQDAPTVRGDELFELDARVSIGRDDGAWEISAFVQNATDEVQITNVELQGNFPQATYSEPRRYGLELLTRF